jgi:hypothetical protein
MNISPPFPLTSSRCCRKCGGQSREPLQPSRQAVIYLLISAAPRAANGVNAEDAKAVRRLPLGGKETTMKPAK